MLVSFRLAVYFEEEGAVPFWLRYVLYFSRKWGDRMECGGVRRLWWATIFCVAFSCGAGCALDLLSQKDAVAIPGKKTLLILRDFEIVMELT